MGSESPSIGPGDLDECWCCGGLHDSLKKLCPDCDDAGCQHFGGECQSDHKPVMPDGGRPGVEVCHVCGDEVPVDGEHAMERFGEVLCRDCSGELVVFRAVCEAAFCDWSYRVDETEWNRGHAKVRAQQEANHHENTKRVFDGEHVHKTEVREVDQEAIA